MTGYVITNQAENDLDEIAAFVGTRNPATAEALLQRVYSLFELLVQHPKAGRERNDLAPSLRELVEGRYLIFYFEGTDVIEIIRVLHGARDIASLFR